MRARYRSVPIGQVYTALRDEGLTAGSVFTTDGELAGGDFRLLTDPRGLFGAQNVAPVVSDDLLGEFGATLREPMDRVSAALTTAAMRRMNAQVSIGQRPPRSRSSSAGQRPARRAALRGSPASSGSRSG